MAGRQLNPSPRDDLGEVQGCNANAAHVSSHVRERIKLSHDRAARRVSEYLKVMGLSDAETIASFAELCARTTQVDDVNVHAESAMREAQRRISQWKEEVFGSFGGEPNPLWLRKVFSQRPDLFLADPSYAHKVIEECGDPRLSHLPATSYLQQQSLARAELPRWLTGLVPTIALTSVVMFLLVRRSTGNPGVFEVAWLMTYALLFGLTSLGSVTALRGLWVLVKSSVHPQHQEKTPSLGTNPRVAIAVPIYHEEAAHVFANIAAIRDTLMHGECGADFEFFVLSDSQDPWCAADEERAFRRITAPNEQEVYGSDDIPIYYRRRTRNNRQKAGNVEEFFEHWGERYEYVFILDADSLMQGTTMVEMVRRMEQNPQCGLLQAPIQLIGGETLLCRALQWSTSVVGPLFTRGLASWAGPHGNYYGHNAVIRTKAFLECCALPTLMGPPPFGGSIMSHDFVEAALLCRGGWQVLMAPDLAGSYEGAPSTLTDYVARDRRWCQGNLQHLRVVLAPGLRMMSRIHLLLGAFAYLAAPLWFAFVALGMTSLKQGGWTPEGALPFVLLPAALLLLPRTLGTLLIAASPASRKAHGGALGTLLTLPLEVLVGSALAPLLLFHHTVIVLRTSLGGFVQWKAQSRNGAHSFRSIAASEWGATLAGLSLLFVTKLTMPEFLVWLSPVWAPLSLAIPVSLLASSRRVGAFLRRCGLLIVPSEANAEPLIVRSDEYRSLMTTDLSGRFRDLILDPVLLEAHVSRLLARRASEQKAATPAAVGQRNVELCERALRLGPSGLAASERERLVEDPTSLRWLHQAAWCSWPTEDWRISRDRPQLPPLSPSIRGSRPGSAAETSLARRVGQRSV